MQERVKRQGDARENHLELLGDEHGLSIRQHLAQGAQARSERAHAASTLSLRNAPMIQACCRAQQGPARSVGRLGRILLHQPLHLRRACLA
jgi:hypothetical protein